MNHRIVPFVSLVLALAACSAGTGPAIEGSFAGSAVTPLPAPPLPEGDLQIEASLVLDGDAGTFELDMDLAALGLTDEMNVRGTYVAANGSITLMPTGYQIPADSPNTQDGLCITLVGFAETVVCLPEMESGEYTDSISLTLEHEIADVEGSTPITLTRTP